MLLVFPGLASQLRGAEGDPAILDLKIVEGDGTVYTTGSRATRGVTVQVNDESAHPVNGATVSFTLPSDGPGGVFVSGGRTEITTTRADGRATVWGMQWNRTPGPFEIRITAAKGQARAGILCASYLDDNRTTDTRLSNRPSDRDTVRPPEERAAAAAAKASRPEVRVGGGGHRWLWIVVGAAGVAAAGAAVVGRAGSSLTAAAEGAVSSVQIGTPSVSLGRP